MLPGEPNDPAGTDLEATDVERVTATLHAICHPRLFTASRHLWWRRPSALLARPFRRRYDHLWPYANAWSAVSAAASIPQGPPDALAVLAGFPAGARAYGRPSTGRDSSPCSSGFDSSVVAPLGPGGDRFFDDNAWLGLAMVRHFDVTGDEEVLDLARLTFSFVVSGWSDDRGAVHPGGVRWREPAKSTARHACSTAPAAELGAALHLRTGDEGPLDWAVRAYEWTRAALGDTGGLYFDRISRDGVVERTVWTYNQGAMVGAGVLLHRATGDPAYLEHAVATTASAQRCFDPPTLVRHGAAFNAIYFRNLFLLADAIGGEAAEPLGIPARAAAYAATAWEVGRDARTGLFVVGESPLNASAPMIEVYALLAGAPPRP